LAFLPVEEMAARQGMPPDMLANLKEHGAFTTKALRIGIGNGVPLPMGRAVARAVVEAMTRQTVAA